MGGDLRDPALRLVPGRGLLLGRRSNVFARLVSGVGPRVVERGHRPARAEAASAPPLDPHRGRRPAHALFLRVRAHRMPRLGGPLRPAAEAAAARLPDRRPSAPRPSLVRSPPREPRSLAGHRRLAGGPAAVRSGAHRAAEARLELSLGERRLGRRLVGRRVDRRGRRRAGDRRLSPARAGRALLPPSPAPLALGLRSMHRTFRVRPPPRHVYLADRAVCARRPPRRSPAGRGCREPLEREDGGAAPAAPGRELVPRAREGRGQPGPLLGAVPGGGLDPERVGRSVGPRPRPFHPFGRPRHRALSGPRDFDGGVGGPARRAPPARRSGAAAGRPAARRPGEDPRGGRARSGRGVVAGTREAGGRGQEEGGRDPLLRPGRRRELLPAR